MAASMPTPVVHLSAINRLSTLLQRVAFVVAALSVKLGLNATYISNTQALILNTSVLTLYLIAEASNLWRHDRRLFFINPIILTSFLNVIGLPYIYTSIIYFLPDDYFSNFGIELIITSWMNQAMFLVMVGANAMWIGYTSTLGRRAAIKLQRNIVANKLLSKSWSINFPIAYLLVATSIVARMISVQLGLYGYIAGDPDTHEFTTVTSANYSMYLQIASGLYTYVVVIIGLKVFSERKPALSVLFQLIFLVCLELLFGLLSGSKGSIIFTLIMIGQLYYSQRHRFPFFLVPVLLAALFIAYGVIEPYRSAMAANQTHAKSLTEIASVMFNSSTDGNSAVDNDVKPLVLLVAMRRINMLSSAAYGIEYDSTHSELPPGSPAFLGNILMAPIYALVPRFVMSDKPLGDLGLWYTREVIGHAYYSYTAMGPFTYLNFAGGLLAVFIGFLSLGILQRTLFEGLAHSGVIGFFIYFCLAGALTNFGSAVDGEIIAFIRTVPITLFMLYILLRHSKKGAVE